MDRKRKMFLLMIFKVFLKNKRKRRKLKFNRLLHDIKKKKKKKKAFLSQKKKWRFYFNNLVA